MSHYFPSFHLPLCTHLTVVQCLIVNLYCVFICWALLGHCSKFRLISHSKLFLGIWVKSFWSLDINIQLKRVATSFSRHFHIIWVNGPTLEAQECHFCNFEWQSGNFVNMSGRFDVTTKLGHLPCKELHSILLHSSRTSIFVL